MSTCSETASAVRLRMAAPFPMADLAQRSGREYEQQVQVFQSPQPATQCVATEKYRQPQAERSESVKPYQGFSPAQRVGEITAFVAGLVGYD